MSMYSGSSHIENHTAGREKEVARADTFTLDANLADAPGFHRQLLLSAREPSFLTGDDTYSGSTAIADRVLVAGVPVAGQATWCAFGSGEVFLIGGTLQTPAFDPRTE
jgi:hypothetical protein